MFFWAVIKHTVNRLWHTAVSTTLVVITICWGSWFCGKHWVSLPHFLCAYPHCWDDPLRTHAEMTTSANVIEAVAGGVACDTVFMYLVHVSICPRAKTLNIGVWMVCLLWWVGWQPPAIIVWMGWMSSVVSSALSGQQTRKAFVYFPIYLHILLSSSEKMSTYRKTFKAL